MSDDALANFEKSLTDLVSSARKGNGHAVPTDATVIDPTDPGVESMREVGGISGESVRKMAAELAKRGIELAEANLKRAQAEHERAKKLADNFVHDGGKWADEIEQQYERNARIAGVFAETRRVIEG